MARMISHFPGSSVKGARSLGAKCATSIAALSMALSVVSCQSPPQGAATSLPDPEEEAVRRLADEAMVCLSTHNYGRLETIMEPGRSRIPGVVVAEALVGSDFHSAVLDRWDARLIQIALIAEREATARVNFSYRRTPNRKPIRTSLTLHFRRASGQGSWHLYLP